MQASSDDVSFEQWLLRALNDPSLPGVIDLSQCTVLTSWSSPSLTAEERGQLKLALQSHSNVSVLKIDAGEHRSFLNVDGLNEIVEPLGKLTALQQLDLRSKILICRFLIILILGRGCDADEGGRHAWWWALFLTRMSDNDFGREGAQALSEPLGKLTALQRLYLSSKILICRFLILFDSWEGM